MPCATLGLVLGLPLALGACTQSNYVTDNSLPRLEGRNIPTSSSDVASPSHDDVVTRVYRLGSGDRLKITVFKETDLSGEFDVSVHGRVAMPLIGDVAAAGFSIQEFRDSVTARLADGYLKSPRVTVEVLNYRPFYVHGEVRTGGEFKYQPGISFRDAIATAGGRTYRGDESFIVLVRHGDGREIKVAMPSQFMVLPGDNIRVPERFF